MLEKDIGVQLLPLQCKAGAIVWVSSLFRFSFSRLHIPFLRLLQSLDSNAAAS